jgi:hypothetical protein
MPTHVRVCSDCGEEYRPDIVRCADCGGALVDRFLEDEQESPGPAEPEAPAGPDLSGFHPVFVSGRATDLVPLAERLRQAEIAFHLAERPVPEGAAPSFSLLVHEDDREHALRALAPLLGSQVEPDEDRGGEEQPSVRCPACGTEQTAGAAECPECGLALGGGEGDRCPRCGGPVPEAGAKCPACGGAPVD